MVSGINHGPNLGNDVHYSGTVAAAMEGALLGVTGHRRLAGGAAAARLHPGGPLRRGARPARWPPRRAPGTLLLNVNVPAGPVRGFRLAPLGKRTYGNEVVEKIDPRGRQLLLDRRGGRGAATRTSPAPTATRSWTTGSRRSPRCGSTRRTSGARRLRGARRPRLRREPRREAAGGLGRGGRGALAAPGRRGCAGEAPPIARSPVPPTPGIHDELELAASSTWCRGRDALPDRPRLRDRRRGLMEANGIADPRTSRSGRSSSSRGRAGCSSWRRRAGPRPPAARPERPGRAGAGRRARPRRPEAPAGLAAEGGALRPLRRARRAAPRRDRPVRARGDARRRRRAPARSSTWGTRPATGRSSSSATPAAS